MPRKREVVKIDNKEYCFKELTVGEIIEEVQDNDFFKAALKGNVEEADVAESTEDNDEAKEEKGSDELQDLSNIISIFRKIAEKSADFKMDELKDFTPSEIRKLYDGFKKANKDFFFIVEKVGILEMLYNLKDQVIADYSKMLVD